MTLEELLRLWADEATSIHEGRNRRRERPSFDPNGPVGRAAQQMIPELMELLDWAHGVLEEDGRDRLEKNGFVAEAAGLDARVRDVRDKLGAMGHGR